MKSSLFILIIIIILSSFYGCKKEDKPKTTAEMIVGKWYLKGINFKYTFDSLAHNESKSLFLRISHGEYGYYGQYYSDFGENGKVENITTVTNDINVFGAWGGISSGDIEFIYPSGPADYKILYEDSIHFTSQAGFQKIKLLANFKDTATIILNNAAYIHNISEDHLLFSIEQSKKHETYKVTYNFGK